MRKSTLSDMTERSSVKWIEKRLSDFLSFPFLGFFESESVMRGMVFVAEAGRPEELEGDPTRGPEEELEAEKVGLDGAWVALGKV